MALSCRQAFQPLLNREELVLLLCFFQPCVGMLAHGDQVDADVPMARTPAARSFQFVIDFLALDAAFDAGSQRIPHSPFLAVAADARKKARVVHGRCVERSSVIGR